MFVWIKGVGTTIKEIIANKPMLIYILSYFFYIDGVHTVISMATTYGIGRFEMILFGRSTPRLAYDRAFPRSAHMMLAHASLLPVCMKK